MLADWELWACAQAVIRQHGKEAGEHAAARVTELTPAGDDEGVRTWMATIDRIDQLSDHSSKGKIRH